MFSKSILYHSAGDSSLIFPRKKLRTTESIINTELKHLVQWLRGNKLSLNEIKTELTIFRSPRKQLPREPDIRLNICKLKLHTYVKYSETTEQRTHRGFKKFVYY